eukprot:10702-Heterococcus_DN1.PRE.2
MQQQQQQRWGSSCSYYSTETDSKQTVRSYTLAVMTSAVTAVDRLPHMNMAVDVAVHTFIMGDMRDGCRLNKRSTSICSSLGFKGEGAAKRVPATHAVAAAYCLYFRSCTAITTSACESSAPCEHVYSSASSFTFNAKTTSMLWALWSRQGHFDRPTAEREPTMDRFQR